MWQKIIDFDHWLLILINNNGTLWQDTFWLRITNTLYWIPFFIVILYATFRFFKKKETLRMLKYVLLILLTTILITNSTKEMVMRLRPLYSADIAPFLRIITKEEGYSFFSGHTSNSFAICMFLYLIFHKHTKWAFGLFLWAVLFSFSRLYLGVHFPSDILIGCFVGCIVGYCYFRFYTRK